MEWEIFLFKQIQQTLEVGLPVGMTRGVGLDVVDTITSECDKQKIILQNTTNNKSKRGKYMPSTCSLIPALYKGSTFLHGLTSSTRREPHYHRNSHKSRPHFLEMIWILTWDHLSEDINNKVKRLFSNSEPNKKRFPQYTVGNDDQSLRMITCYT